MIKFMGVPERTLKNLKGYLDFGNVNKDWKNIFSASLTPQKSCVLGITFQVLTCAGKWIWSTANRTIHVHLPPISHAYRLGYHEAFGKKSDS